MSDQYDPQPPGEQPPNPYGQPPQPTQPYGQSPAQPYPQPYGQPYAQQPGYPQPGYQQPGYPAYGQKDPDSRPGTVTAAAVITLILSVLTLLFGIVLVALGVSGADSFTEGFRDGAGSSYDDFSDDDIANLMLGVGAFLALWCVASIVLAIMAMRRSKVGRVLLVISSAVTILVSLVSILSVVSLVTLIGAIAVTVLLFVGGANDWYARRGPVLPVGTTQPWG